MNLFILEEKTPLRIVSVTPRREKHGAEKVPALTWSMEWETTNAVLLKFHPALRSMLYEKRSGPQDGQGELPGTEVSDTPNLRFPKLGMPIAWEQVQSGMKMSLDLGKKPLVLDDCTVDEFKITTKEGGTTIVRFRCAMNHLDENAAGKLGVRVDQVVDAYLVAGDSLQQTIAETGAETGAEPQRGDSWPFPRNEGAQTDQAATETNRADPAPEPPKPETKRGKGGTKASTLSSTEAFLAANTNAGESA